MARGKMGTVLYVSPGDAVGGWSVESGAGEPTRRPSSRRWLAWLLLLVLALGCPAWAQSPPPRETDAPAEFEFGEFSNRLLEHQSLLGERRVHFVFLVDVTASVANDVLDFWRRDVFMPMCEKFLVTGDKVSVVPFGMRANWLDALVAQPYQRNDIANIVAQFPRQVMAAEDRGTDIYGSIGEVLDAAEKKGWINDNLFIIVLTDDQIQGPEPRSNKKFGGLWEKHLKGNPTFAKRYLYTKRKAPKEYSIYAYSNNFPDKSALPKTRLQQVGTERTGTPGGSSGGASSGTSAGSPAVAPPASPGASTASPSPSAAASASPSPSPSPAASAKRPPRFPWWVLLVLLAAIIVAWLLLRPVGFRYKIDGAPGKIRSGDRPVAVSTGQPQEPVGDLKVSGGKLLFVPRKGFSVAGRAAASGAASTSSARQSGARARSKAVPAGAPPVPLAPGSGGEYRAHELEVNRDATSSAGWSQAAGGPQKVGSVKIEVATLGATSTRTRSGAQKKGPAA